MAWPGRRVGINGFAGWAKIRQQLLQLRLNGGVGNKARIAALDFAQRQQHEQRLMRSPYTFALEGVDAFELLEGDLIVHEAKDINYCYIGVAFSTGIAS